MQIYMKHPTEGNSHFPESDQAELEAKGWVRWPRTAEQKRGASVVVDSVAPEAPAAIEVDRAALLIRARELGIKVDGRWRDERIAEAIENMTT